VIQVLIINDDKGVCRYQTFLPFLKSGLRSFHAIQGFEIEPGASTLSRDPQPKPHNLLLETDLLPAQNLCGIQFWLQAVSSYSGVRKKRAFNSRIREQRW
jgi:hypothetical protein